MERLVIPDFGDCPNCGWAANACHCVPKPPTPRGTVRQVLVFKDGSVAALDDGGKRIVALQRRTIIEAFAKLANDMGYATEGCKFESPWGNGWIVGGQQQFDRGDVCPTTGELNCPKCSGEYCMKHFARPCECDVTERHRA